MKPVEGTILTVAHYPAKHGVRKLETSNDIIEVMGSVYVVLKISENSDCAVLKEVGVVGSGGQVLYSLPRILQWGSSSCSIITSNKIDLTSTYTYE